MSYARAVGLVPAIVVAAFAAFPVIATASAPAEGIRVAYGDLNLSTPAGIDALYARIRAAASHYCEPAREPTGSRLASQYDQCVKETIATTVAKVNVPGLSALHAVRAGASHS
jgi:UrcA family protein